MAESLAFCLHIKDHFFLIQKKPFIKTPSGEVGVHRCVCFTICIPKYCDLTKCWHHHSFGQDRVETAPLFKSSSFLLAVPISWNKKKPPCPQGTTPQGTGWKYKISLGLVFFFCFSRSNLSYPTYYQSTSDPAAFFCYQRWMGEGDVRSVCFELLCFHENSRNYIFILTQKDIRTACCRWSRVERSS